jgi:hypothetical protein
MTGFPGMWVDPPTNSKWGNYFNVILSPDMIGCAGPCLSAVNVTLNLTAAPASSNVTLVWNWTGTAVTYYPTVGNAIFIGNPVTVLNTTVLNLSAAVHFDTVGDYELCFEFICPAGTPSCGTVPPCVVGDVSIAKCCFPISVYQWATAEKIELYRKWNLISLPLVPLVNPNPIADVLAASTNASLIKGVYTYDCEAKDWLIYGNGQTSLTTMEDGPAYWVKVDYVLGNPAKAPGLPIGGLWVFGTPQPVPPSAPAAYHVCAGWNMVGITGYNWGSPTTDQLYLWNWYNPGPPSYGWGAIYGWDPANLAFGTQVWYLLDPPGGPWWLPWVATGEGYWISFAQDGMIYPP